jgi:capsular polysaccharide biosynthesis protein
MRTEPELRPSRERLPDFDGEDEVDFGRYARAVAARWWLPVAGLIAGVVVGYLVSFGGKDVYEARTTIYLGQPLSASGTQIQGPSTNPAAVRQVVFSRWAQHRAEVSAGLRNGALTGHVSTQAVAGAAPALGRVGQTPDVLIIVTGSQPLRIAAAADALATIATQQVSGGYVATKIAFLKRQVAAQNAALKSIDRTIAILRAGAGGSGLSLTDRLIVASQLNGQTLQRSQVVDQLATYQNQLALAQTVEQSKILVPARAVKTTARSRRNTIIVAAVIGLLLGLLAALLWEPLARIARRTSA